MSQRRRDTRGQFIQEQGRGGVGLDGWLENESNALPLTPSAVSASIMVRGHTGLRCPILILAMTKRKPSRFSVTKAVKANARERVGQPKPTRVVQEKPGTGRGAKHKPSLEQILRQEE